MCLRYYSVNNRCVIAVLLLLVAMGCANKKQSARSVQLKYHLYVNDSLVQENALHMEYCKLPGGTVCSVIVRLDTLHPFTFYEKRTDKGIWHSQNDSVFTLTHSFVRGERLLFDWGLQVPFFANTWVDVADEKKFFDGNDSVAVIKFSEAIMGLTGSVNYYVKEYRIFAVYSEPETGRYYKLTHVEEEGGNQEQLMEVVRQLVNDTVFFNRHIRLPALPPPD